jgi:hypothetical protein
MYCARIGWVLRGKLGQLRTIRVPPVNSFLAPDTDALQLDAQFGALPSLRARLLPRATTSEYHLYPCYPRDPWLVRFRRERGDDFFEARIAA